MQNQIKRRRLKGRERETMEGREGKERRWKGGRGKRDDGRERRWKGGKADDGRERTERETMEKEKIDDVRGKKRGKGREG
jgi:hypothetical protein